MALKSKIILYFTIATLIIGCGYTEAPEFLEFEPKIVVDGSIIVGERPEIVLTQLIPPNSELDSSTLSYVPLRWAKVTVSCGDESEVLVGSKDDKYMTKFYYRALHLRGEEGKSYKIDIEYGDTEVSGTTSLLSPVGLCDLWAEKGDDQDSLFVIKAKIDDPLSDGNHYVISSLVVGLDSIYKPTVMGIWNDSRLKEQDNVIPIFRSLSVLQTGKDMGIFYKSGEQVLIEIAHVEEPIYNYFLDQQELFINSANPIYPVTSNARTNIDGGLGCWAGKAVKRYNITIPEK